MADQSTDREDELSDAAKLARRWIADLDRSEKAQNRWLNRSRKVYDRYSATIPDSSNTASTTRRYSILWANTQTIQPAVYARPPEPVVSRRFKDADPVGRLASEVLERALSYSIDKQDLDGVLRTCSLDYVLLSRAQTWERYVPHRGATQELEVIVQVTNDASVYVDDEGQQYPADAVSARDDGKMVAKSSYEPIVFEESVTDYVHWSDFGHGPGRSWDEVPFVWRRVYMDRDQLKERFGRELGMKVPLDWGAKEDGAPDQDGCAKAAIYEVWCKRSRKAYWISKSYPEAPLDERDDPLRLDGFFPCPRPLFGTLAANGMEPVPDYLQYQDQAEEVDKLTGRITALQDALKVKGFYAAANGEDLNALLAASNNELIPVQAWQTFTEGGGLGGHIEWWPLDKVIQALRECIVQRKALIDDIYQITGVSDIMRGSTDPRETAAAQGYKVGFGSLRTRDRQNEMLRFARDVLRIKASLIAEHFDIETLSAMTGVQIPTAAQKAAAEARVRAMMAQAQRPAMPGQPPPAPPPIPPAMLKVLQSPTWEDVVELLRNNALRGFRIDVETDSTIQPNESQEKAQAVEFVQALGGFFAQAGPLIQAAPQTAPMFAEITKAVVRRFRFGREVEASIEQTLDQIAAAPPPGAQGAEAEPPPDQTPVQVAQLNLQRENVKQQGENQRAGLEAQIAQQDNALRQNEQQLKVVALQRDPVPQVGV